MPISFDGRFKVYRLRETIRLPNGKPLRLIASGATKGAAKAEFEKKRLEAIADADRAAAPRPSKSFEVFANEWLVTYPAAAKNRETTRLEKTYHVRVRLIPYFTALGDARGAPMTLADITPKVIDRLIADLSEAPKMAAGKADQRARKLEAPRALAPQTVRNILQTLRRMLASAKRWDEIDVLPDVPTVKAGRQKCDFLDFEEAERLLAAIKDEDDFDLLMTKMRLGLRVGELIGLQWSQLDFVKREARIETQLAHNSIRLVPVKAGPRTVPLSGRLWARLKARKHLRGPWVFCDGEGAPFTRFDVRRKLERWLKRAGLRTMTPHALRHTFASHLVMRGVPLKNIQEWCGHSSIQTTMRYAHLAPGAGAKMIEVLDSGDGVGETTQRKKAT